MDAARNALEVEELRLIQELDDVGQNQKALQAELKRVRGALAALTGEPARSSGGARPALPDSEALQFVTTALRSGPLPRSELQARGLAYCREHGFSGTGLHLALKRILRDPRFREQNGTFFLLSEGRAAAS